MSSLLTVALERNDERLGGAKGNLGSGRIAEVDPVADGKDERNGPAYKKPALTQLTNRPSARSQPSPRRGRSPR